MYQIRSARVVFNVEVLENGKVAGSREVPVQIFEAQFETVSLATLADQLLSQVNGSPEVKEDGGDKKEE